MNALERSVNRSRMRLIEKYGLEGAENEFKDIPNEEGKPYGFEGSAIFLLAFLFSLTVFVLVLRSLAKAFGWL